MGNPFKVGDNIVINEGIIECQCCVSPLIHTVGKAYSLTHVGTWANDSTKYEPTAVGFANDAGGTTTLSYGMVHLAKE